MFFPPTPLIDGNGVHLPPGATDYRAPSSVDNGQQNITQEIRLQSTDPNARLIWTTGVFFSENRQSYLEQIHDPLLNELSLALTGAPYTDFFVDANGNPVTFDPRFPDDSYFLKTNAKDEQYAAFGELTYGLTERLKATLGARFSRTKFSFDTLTGGPQLFDVPRTGTGDNKENSFTPKVSLQFQADSSDMFYATYAKGFRPGGANNPVPYAACSGDFMTFNIPGAPQTFSSDTVNSYEIGAKNNFNNRVKLASSIYYIKWNNIQQTVVPPVCQISFIANLGQAAAKGVDLQADVAVTDHLALELAAGYTEARYSKDSRFNALEQIPVVANGDAIVGVSSETGGGQPTAPYTVSVGLQYRFSAFAHEAFVRADGEYQGRSTRCSSMRRTSCSTPRLSSACGGVCRSAHGRWRRLSTISPTLTSSRTTTSRSTMDSATAGCDVISRSGHGRSGSRRYSANNSRALLGHRWPVDLDLGRRPRLEL